MKVNFHSLTLTLCFANFYFCEYAHGWLIPIKAAVKTASNAVSGRTQKIKGLLYGSDSKENSKDSKNDQMYEIQDDNQVNNHVYPLSNHGYNEAENFQNELINLINKQKSKQTSTQETVKVIANFIQNSTNSNTDLCLSVHEENESCMRRCIEDSQWQNVKPYERENEISENTVRQVENYLQTDLKNEKSPENLNNKIIQIIRNNNPSLSKNQIDISKRKVKEILAKYDLSSPQINYQQLMREITFYINNNSGRIVSGDTSTGFEDKGNYSNLMTEERIKIKMVPKTEKQVVNYLEEYLKVGTSSKILTNKVVDMILQNNPYLSEVQINQLKEDVGQIFLDFSSSKINYNQCMEQIKFYIQNDGQRNLYSQTEGYNYQQQPAQMKLDERFGEIEDHKYFVTTEANVEMLQNKEPIYVKRDDRLGQTENVPTYEEIGQGTTPIGVQIDDRLGRTKGAPIYEEIGQGTTPIGIQIDDRLGPTAGAPTYEEIGQGTTPIGVQIDDRLGRTEGAPTYEEMVQGTTPIGVQIDDRLGPNAGAPTYEEVGQGTTRIDVQIDDRLGLTKGAPKYEEIGHGSTPIGVQIDDRLGRAEGAPTYEEIDQVTTSTGVQIDDRLGQTEIVPTYGEIGQGATTIGAYIDNRLVQTESVSSYGEIGQVTTQSGVRIDDKLGQTVSLKSSDDMENAISYGRIYQSTTPFNLPLEGNFGQTIRSEIDDNTKGSTESPLANILERFDGGVTVVPESQNKSLLVDLNSKLSVQSLSQENSGVDFHWDRLQISLEKILQDQLKSISTKDYLSGVSVIIDFIYKSYPSFNLLKIPKADLIVILNDNLRKAIEKGQFSKVSSEVFVKNIHLLTQDILEAIQIRYKLISSVEIGKKIKSSVKTGAAVQINFEQVQQKINEIFESLKQYSEVNETLLSDSLTTSVFLNIPNIDQYLSRTLFQSRIEMYLTDLTEQGYTNFHDVKVQQMIVAYMRGMIKQFSESFKYKIVFNITGLKDVDQERIEKEISKKIMSFIFSLDADIPNKQKIIQNQVMRILDDYEITAIIEIYDTSVESSPELICRAQSRQNFEFTTEASFKIELSVRESQWGQSSNVSVDSETLQKQIHSLVQDYMEEYGFRADIGPLQKDIAQLISNSGYEFRVIVIKTKGLKKRIIFEFPKYSYAESLRMRKTVKTNVPSFETRLTVSKILDEKTIDIETIKATIGNVIMEHIKLYKIDTAKIPLLEKNVQEILSNLKANIECHIILKYGAKEIPVDVNHIGIEA